MEKVKFLILQTNNLGDIILATPALQILRESFPKADITLAVSSRSKQYIDGFPLVDRIIYFNNPFKNRNKKVNLLSKIRILSNSLKSLRKERYDIIIELTGQIMNQFYLPFLKADYKIGQVNNPINLKIFNNIVLNKKVISGKRRNEIQRGLDVIQELKRVEVKKIPKPWYPSAQEDEMRVERILQEREIKGFVAMHPITPWKPREWPKKRFAVVADWIIKNKDLNIIFIGSKDEREEINKIVHLMKTKKRQRVFNFAGLVTIKQVAALLKKAGLFLGNDSGIAHLAATTKVPAIVIFGPGDERRWGHKEQIIVRKYINCYPCKQNFNKYKCKRGYSTCKALQEISLEEIIGRVEDSKML